MLSIKSSVLFQTVLESEARGPLPTVQLDLSWTLKCPIDKMIALQGHLTI